ncbi:rab guanine nucleotide exchange factor S2 [Podochytrium sp. JEL0797]|nr:rab guanine nucleotide exchange factor S2 [Podochytrium sp. JEL0797]
MDKEDDSHAGGANQLGVSCCSSTPILSQSEKCPDQITILNLEAKISDMEAAHKSALEKLQREKSHLTQDMLKKNQIIDKMRIKINRYEFALKEAILFLAKPMEAYEIWLNNKSSENNNGLVVNAIQGALSAANTVYSAGPSYLGGNLNANASPTPSTSGTPTTAPSRSRNPSTTPASSPSKSKIGSHSASSLAIATDSASLLPPLPTLTAPTIGGATNLEIHCMECMRLSLNYLKNAQSSINSMEKDDNTIAVIPAPIDALLPNPLQLLNIKPLDDALRDLHSQTTAPSNTHSSSSSTSPTHPSEPAPPHPSPSHSKQSSQAPPVAATAISKSRALAFARLHSPERRQSTHITNIALLHAATIPIPTTTADEIDPNDGDISTNQKTSTTSTSIDGPNTTEKTTSRTCPACREYMLQLDQYRDTVESLREDVKTLATQITEERAIRDRNQLAKDILDQELEELTSQLFDQANKMVIDEARMRDELEISNRDLKGELKELVGRCEKREEELKELNRNLKALEAAKLRASVYSIHSGNGGSQTGSLANITPTSLSPAGNLFPKPSSAHTFYSSTRINQPLPLTTIPIDGVLFTEFQDHLRQVMSTLHSPTNPNPTPPTTANETHFMKRCIAEDVEPCLFTAYPILTPGPGGLLSTTKLTKPGPPPNGLHPFKKRLLDALLKGHLETILLDPPTDATSPSTTTPSPPKTKCTACTHLRPCPTLLRITDKLPADTSPLCPFCADRVSTVIDFYTYMAHVRQGVIGPGKQGVTVVGMLRHAVWLRRRMGVARVGVCGLFEGEGLVAVDRRGGEVGEWEKLVQIIP